MFNLTTGDKLIPVMNYYTSEKTKQLLCYNLMFLPREKCFIATNVRNKMYSDLRFPEELQIQHNLEIIGYYSFVYDALSNKVKIIEINEYIQDPSRSLHKELLWNSAIPYWADTDKRHRDTNLYKYSDVKNLIDLWCMYTKLDVIIDI